MPVALHSCQYRRKACGAGPWAKLAQHALSGLHAYLQAVLTSTSDGLSCNLHFTNRL